MPNLKSSVVHSGFVTNAGMTQIARLQNLQSLDLMYTKVTDTGMADIAKLQNLRLVDFYGTKVTDKMRQEIKHSCDKNTSRLTKEKGELQAADAAGVAPASNEPIRNKEITATDHSTEAGVYDTTEPNAELGYSQIVAGLPSNKSRA